MFHEGEQIQSREMKKNASKDKKIISSSFIFHSLQKMYRRDLKNTGKTSASRETIETLLTGEESPQMEQNFPAKKSNLRRSKDASETVRIDATVRKELMEQYAFFKKSLSQIKGEHVANLQSSDVATHISREKCEKEDAFTLQDIAPSDSIVYGSIKAVEHCDYFVVDPQGHFYIFWLTLVTLCYVYNCVTIPLRITFPYETNENRPVWMLADFCMDFIYWMDLMFIRPRLMFLEEGIWITNTQQTRKHYCDKFRFKMDVLSVIPADLFYNKLGIALPFLRIPRLFKLHVFLEFFDRFDKILVLPYVTRVARTMAYTLYLVHLNTCAYYEVSVREGIGSNKWVYNGEGNAYLRCFYRAVKTATSIGKNPKPNTDIEYVFMTYSWLMGCFVFAVLIGQIRYIVSTAGRSQTEYRKLTDATLDYLRRMNVPPESRQRFEQWFSFNWEQQRTLDESRVLDFLPSNIKTDVAINVHYGTLSKVELFRDCEEALLRELVLKLQPVLFQPGDYVCRKGEIGKEMYIVKRGQVQVIDATEEYEAVLATLTEGAVFGEVTLLNLEGKSQRTADVRSHGFSSLFVLSKSDLDESVKFYPGTEEIIKRNAKKLIEKSRALGNADEIPLKLYECEGRNSVIIRPVLRRKKNLQKRKRVKIQPSTSTFSEECSGEQYSYGSIKEEELFF